MNYPEGDSVKFGGRADAAKNQERVLGTLQSSKEPDHGGRKGRKRDSTKYLGKEELAGKPLLQGDRYR